ncbi:MAG: TIGR03943 family protein [Akkermansiaceae bacterium]|nr:TIGR03943 family protein [Akkermansiaceae bacterium]
MTSLDTRLFGFLACLWGSLLIYFYHSTRIRDYLDVGFHHFIMVGGIGMLILGIYSFINPKSQSEKNKTSQSCDHDHGHRDDEQHSHDHNHCHDHGDHCNHDHEEGHGPFVTILLTLAPLILAMTYTQDKLSNGGMAKKGLYEKPALTSANIPPFTREDLEKNVPKNEHGEFQLRMISAYYAAGDLEIQDIFDGLPVELEGRIAPEKINNESGDRLRIFRSIITCCAADLQIVGVALEFPGGSNRPQVEDWVKASGTLTFETVEGDVLPLLKIREVIPAEEPYSEFRRRQ